MSSGVAVERVSRRHRGWRIALVIAAVVFLSGWWLFNSEFMAIDSCLDAGGRWGESGACEFAEPGA